jgi:hypothetical protein
MRTRIATRDDRGEVPSEIAKNLEKEFGIVPNYQRQITKRLTDKIKANIPKELNVTPIRKQNHEKDQGNDDRQTA